MSALGDVDTFDQRWDAKSEEQRNLLRTQVQETLLRVEGYTAQWGGPEQINERQRSIEAQLRADYRRILAKQVSSQLEEAKATNSELKKAKL